LTLESKDVNRLIEQAVERLALKAREAGITIELELEPLFPIKLDASLISKVLNNLIDNALKYSPTHSQVVIKTEDEGDFIRVSVQDQGIGLTEEEQQNLFTRFYRAKNDVTTQISGTGLGLYLTKFFVEAHQGRVEVISQKGLGSTFTIWISSNLDPAQLQSTPGLLVASNSKTDSQPFKNSRSDSI
ncbi:MAG: HAMP domain-containing histidine kinase, partial [Proteobacteria bacterium]